MWENSAIPTQLKYVDPNRPRSLFSRAYAAFSGTRLGKFISANIVWKVDPYLLRATRGRIGMGLVLPTALLETRGAKSGVVRRNAVIYFHDEDGSQSSPRRPYRRDAAKANRTIPIVQLTARESDAVG